MVHNQYSVAQIVAAVKQHEMGVSAANIAHKLSPAPRFLWIAI